MVGADCQQIAHPALADAAAQLTSAVYYVAGHEGGADPQRLRMFQQGGSQLRLGSEHHLLRHADQLAVLLIGGAPLGQVQLASDQRVPAAGGIGQGDRHLAQRDAAQGAAVLAGRAGASDFWVQTTSHDHAFIDRTTTGIEDTLTAHGYDVSSEIVYARLANETASNRMLTTTLAAVGLLVVAISMAGLANALTMSVLERWC